MAKKRKSLATSLDEVDRTMYSTFCSAANSLSQLYSQAMSHQKLSFLSGERHGLEKLHQWICKQQGEGLRVTSDDILAYIQLMQGEVECCVEEAPSMTPTRSVQQVTSPFTNSGPSIDQQPARNYIFSNALSSPVRRNLQNYHISQAQAQSQAHEGADNNNKNNQHRDSSFDSSSMDMHADHP